MPPVNFNKLLENSNNNNNRNKSANFNKMLNALNQSSAESNSNFLSGIEKSSNYLITNSFHNDSGLKDKRIKLTKPSLIMFNAIVNSGFQKSNRKLELGMIAENIAKTKLPFEKYTYPNNGISIQVKKITGRYGRLQPAFTITNAYSHTGANIFNERVFVLEFLISLSLSSETVNATMSIFSNGKIKLSGGYLNQHDDNMNNQEFFDAQPELIREYIVNNYTNKENFLRNDFKFNNVVCEVRVNKGFNLYVVSGMAFRNKNVSTQFNPELSSNMFLKYGTYDFVISPRGVVKIQGLTEHDDVEEAYELLIQFINGLSDFEKSEKPDEKGRIRRAFTDINVSNARIKKGVVFNPNLPAPEVTRRGTSCPKNRCPDPYSMQGKCPKAGYYVRPNPQGQPCCYKIPKNTKYSEKKVFNKFKRANVKVPNTVKRVFNFGQNTNNKRNNTSHAKLNNLTVKMNSKVGLKIGSRQCMRYSKVALVDIAHRLGLPVSPGMDRPRLCALIQTAATNVTNTNNVKGSRAVKFSLGNSEYVVTGNSPNSLKIAGRFAKTIKKDKLYRYALKLRAPIKETSTIAELCKGIYDRMVALRPKTPSPAKSKTPSPRPRPSPNKPDAMAALRKLRLTKNLVEEDVRKFVGPQWIEKRRVTNAALSRKAEEIYNSLGNAVSNGRVALAAKNIKEFKKGLLKAWKSETNVADQRLKYARLPYYPNVIQAVQNFASTRNAEGKFPKHANVLKYANVRSKVARNSNFLPLKPLGKRKGVNATVEEL
jgi:hypothetical protein